MSGITYAVVFVAEFLAIVGFAASSPVIPSFLRQMGIVELKQLKLWSGLANALPSLVLALVAPLWGILADTYGRKPMLMRAMLGGSLTVALISICVKPSHFLILRCVQGCLTGTVAAATVLVASTAPKEKMAFRLGFLQTAVFLGNSAGPIVGGFFADHWGNRASFYLTAVLLGLAGLMVALFVKENFKPIARAEGFGPGALAPLGAPGLLPLLVITFVYQVCAAAPNPILPLFIEEMVGKTDGVRLISGMVIGCLSVTAALSAAASSRLQNRFGQALILFICLLCSALCYILQSLATNIGQLLAFRSLAGCFLGSTMPAVNGLIAFKTPAEHQGKVFGLSTSVGQGGAALGPAIGAGLSMFANYRAVFLCTGLILACSSIGTADYLRRRAKTQ